MTRSNIQHPPDERQVFMRTSVARGEVGATFRYALERLVDERAGIAALVVEDGSDTPPASFPRTVTGLLHQGQPFSRCRTTDSLKRYGLLPLLRSAAGAGAECELHEFLRREVAPG
jgi:hypothetical protein